MKLIELKCKNCGTKIKVKENSKNVLCQICSSSFKIDDEIKNENLELKKGYDFEKGRIAAIKDESKKAFKSVYVGIIIAVSIIFIILILGYISEKVDGNRLTKEELMNSAYQWISQETAFGKYYYTYYFTGFNDGNMKVIPDEDYNLDGYGMGYYTMKSDDLCDECTFVWSLKDNQVAIMYNNCKLKKEQEILKYENNQLGFYQKINIDKDYIHCSN